MSPTSRRIVVVGEESRTDPAPVVDVLTGRLAPRTARKAVLVLRPVYRIVAEVSKMLDDVALLVGLAGLEGHHKLSVHGLAAPEEVRDELVSALPSDPLHAEQNLRVVAKVAVVVQPVGDASRVLVQRVVLRAIEVTQGHPFACRVHEHEGRYTGHRPSRTRTCRA